MVIYTKKGDRGKTKVFDKKSGKLIGISKKSCKIRAIGAIDELNSFLGIVKSGLRSEMWDVSKKNKYKYEKKIQKIQGDLFTINSILAGSNLKFETKRVKELEREIDEWEGTLPVQKNFIYYGGSEVTSLVFYARALCRRCERSLVSFYSKSHYSLPTTHYPLIYLNRLSDYLFMMGRKVNNDQNIEEEYWIGNKVS